MQKTMRLIWTILLAFGLCGCSLVEGKQSGPVEADDIAARFFINNTIEGRISDMAMTWILGETVIGSEGIHPAEVFPVKAETIPFSLSEKIIPENTSLSEFGFKLTVTDCYSETVAIEMMFPLEKDHDYTYTLRFDDGKYTLWNEAEDTGIDMIPVELTENLEPEEIDDSAVCYDLTGPWYLDVKGNDPDYLAESFPGYGEWGSSMEIRSNGQISWYIGAEGWNGTYKLDSNGLRANMISDLDKTEKTWLFQLVEESGSASLKMDYNGTDLVWKYGDQPDSPAGEDAAE